MDLHLQDKIVMITGSSQGIGLAIARGLHEEGCRIVLHGRNKEKLRTVAQQMGDVEYLLGDVTDPDECFRLSEEIRERFGHLDGLVCNVGSGSSVPPGLESYSEWQRVFDINLFSTTNMIESCRSLLAAKQGTVVCISSICGHELLGAPLTYSAAKAALNHYIRGIARPLALDGVRINGISPGNILCEDGVWERKLEENKGAVEAILQRDVALQRLGTGKEIADSTAFLLSSCSDFATGAIFVMDGGQLRS
jgi:3-oxoacyl-[acyl-carrier protein] reductase